jgi:hypothetical protein
MGNHASGAREFAGDVVAKARAAPPSKEPPLASWDPLALGIHRAITVPGQPLNDLPSYLARPTTTMCELSSGSFVDRVPGQPW